MSEIKLSIFQEKQIRKVYHNDEWCFSVEDVVFALTDSKNPKDYISKVRKRDEELKKGWGQIVHTLEIETKGGKQRVNCVNTKGAFRLIQSIPSKKAEPFKQWLSQVGYERVQEIENPELAMDRMKSIYEQKGYKKDWIDKRLRGIAVRKDLTDEWDERGIEIGSIEFGQQRFQRLLFEGLLVSTRSINDLNPRIGGIIGLIWNLFLLCCERLLRLRLGK